MNDIRTLRPHPEELRSGVSKDGSRTVLFSIHPSRRGQKAAPQDEASPLFDGDSHLVICLTAKHKRWTAFERRFDSRR
jgi:hypothetical protein